MNRIYLLWTHYEKRSPGANFTRYTCAAAGNCLKQLVVLKYPNLWLKFCHVPNFKRKSRYFSTTSCSEVCYTNAGVSKKIKRNARHRKREKEKIIHVDSVAAWLNNKKLISVV